MKLTAEISNYPLTSEYTPIIDSFLERLSRTEGLSLKINCMSTQVWGDMDVVMDAISKEIKYSMEHFGKMIFVVKYLNGYQDESPLNLAFER